MFAGSKAVDNSILTGSNLSNNRRWLLYKQKKSQEQLEPPADDRANKRQSAEGESLASRLDSLQQQQQRDVAAGGAEGSRVSAAESAERLQGAAAVAAAGSTAREDGKPDLSGLISKAKDGLNTSSKPFEQPRKAAAAAEPEVPKSDSDLQWEEIEKYLSRDLKIQGYDFSDLGKADDINLLDVPVPAPAASGAVPPAPQFGMGFGVPPPPPMLGVPPPPPVPGMPPAPPPPPGGFVPPPPGLGGSTNDLNTLGKNKKTMKLHWKEAQAEYTLPSGRAMDTIWKRMTREFHLIKIDSEKLEHLFETRTSEIKQKVGSHY